MTIGVAYSTTPAGEAALALAAREAALRRTPLVILNVTDTPENAADPAGAERAREQVAARLAAADAPADLEWSLRTEGTQGNLADALTDLAEQAGVEILVIGSRRRSAVGKLVMGSTVRQVVMNAPMPVLVTKP